MKPEAMLELLRARRSVREFTPRSVPREVLARIVEAATTAPSAANRQPWRFTLVTAPECVREIAEAVRARLEEMKSVIGRGHHAGDLGGYLDYFYRPLETAAALLVPQYRVHADLIARLLESGGGDPKAFPTSEEMQVERCATSAAVMLALLQAHAEGLGACWMSGPMVARDALESRLRIRPPWQMLGLVALGYPAAPPSPTSRRAISQVVEWWEGPNGAGA